MDSHDQNTCARTTERIRELNDRLRKRHEGGRVMMTQGICALPVSTIARILIAIRDADTFDKRNDPYGEHDFGSVEVDGHHAFWKIDYYGVDLESGSPDPADEAVTARVMTVLLASEY